VDPFALNFAYALLCPAAGLAESSQMHKISRKVRIASPSRSARTIIHGRGLCPCKTLRVRRKFAEGTPKVSVLLQNRVYRFAEFRLHADEHLLLRGEERVLLWPRNFNLLVKLVENAGRLLTKEALVNEVWEGSFVEEGNLNRTISNLRKALGEKPNENRFIETIPRVGYRFVAPVELVTSSAALAESVATASDLLPKRGGGVTA
jgi:DNA-binding winged helix-turn-helix (wHTH) protein